MTSCTTETEYTTNVVEDNENFGMSYCRHSSTKRRELETLLISKYYPFKNDSLAQACIFPSGMNAICALIQTICTAALKNNIVPHLVFGDEMYCDIRRTVRYFESIFNFTYQYIDIRDSQKFLLIPKEKGNRLSLLFIESCTNPSAQMMDFRILKQWKSMTKNCIICVDNTWLTSKLFNPFSYGADVVIESTTKYISASHSIGGMMIGRTKWMKDVQNWLRIYGQYVLPIHCQYCIDGINSLEQRILSSSAISIEIAKYLEKNSNVNRVLYPQLPSHPTYQLNKQFLKDNLGPSVILFHVNKTFKTKKEIISFLKLSTLKLETSYGSTYSKIDPWPTMGGHKDHDYPKQKEGSIPGIWLRLAIGYEDTAENIIQGLEPLFV